MLFRSGPRARYGAARTISRGQTASRWWKLTPRKLGFTQSILTFVEIGMVYSQGQPHHDCIALVLGLFALPFAPVGARLSLDAVIAARLRKLPPLDTAPWAALPLRFTQCTAALGYFFAGASKLAIGGLTWLNGYSLQAIMLHFHGDWTPFFASHVLGALVVSAGEWVRARASSSGGGRASGAQPSNHGAEL